MARNTPRVDETMLIGQDGAASVTVVGSPAWFAWLEDATIFAFSSASGSFTARKERSGPTGWYWKAYRKQHGTLHRAYLGKSADLTHDRLVAVATDLAERGTGRAAVESVVSPLPAFSHDEASYPSATIAPPLLATKFYIPSLRSNFVPRPRLIARVQTGLKGKLTLIAAPAGFGKTTLVTSLITDYKDSNQQSIQMAWVSLDADDNDATRFWSYLIAALETVYPGVGDGIGALLRSPQSASMEFILTTLINAISSTRVNAALVLDDYHLIVTPAIHTAMTFLLDHLPPQLHLVMLTRADPPLPLTRLRTRGELTEVRVADLRFTPDEAVLFLTEIMGLPLTDNEVAALESRTEGWIAGLQLAALALHNRNDHAGFVAAFSGSNRFVVDYLAEEVLDRLPTHLQTFVLQTSILDRLCGSLCDALLLGDKAATDGHAYSQVVLEELERANLFLVPLDDERHWYRYHHLFAEVLRARLHSGATTGELARLYGRADAWHEREGLIGEAVRYAFLGNDVEHAAALIERHAQMLMLRNSDVLQVQDWVSHLPRSLILARPQLALTVATTMSFMGQFDAVEQLLAEAAPAFEAPDLPANTKAELTALRATVARFQGDTSRSFVLAQQALAHLDQDNHIIRASAALNIGVASIWRGEVTAAKTALLEAAALGEAGGSPWVALAALEELTSLQTRHGQLREMRRTCEQAAHIIARMDGQRLPAAGLSQLGIAEAFYEWNDLVGAIGAVTQGIDLLRGTVERVLLARGYILLARIYQARGDTAAALDSIERGEAWFAQTPIAATDNARAWLAAYRARLWVQQGHLVDAAHWAQECAFVGDSELACVQQMTLARLLLAQSSNERKSLLAEANALLAQLLPALETRAWMRYIIEHQVIRALGCEAQGDQPGALAAMECALTLAEPERFVRIFVDEGAPIATLLAQIARGQSSVARYAATLLEAFPSVEFNVLSSELPESKIQNSKLKTQNFLVEPLSQRELDILHMIAAGHSNQAIADTLVIAVSTVKTHINNIYGKLQVRSRTQAIHRMRELNLS